MVAALSKETQMSIQASSNFPGFRFSPTDVELISYYLKNKIDGHHNCVELISQVEICLHEPWDLPGQSAIHSDNEWFFFAARGKKYPNGSQCRRATELGYWKATGKERSVKFGSTVVGTKRTLVFHIGRAPKGERTQWIMHEYSMHGKQQGSLVVCRLRRNTGFRVNGNGKRNAEIVASNEAAGKCCNSSYDSESIELLDCVSDESKHKLSNEAPLPESFPQLPEVFQFAYDFDNSDDFYADILNDDIVALDDTLANQLSEWMADGPPNTGQDDIQPDELIMAPESAFNQGTANRRIKLDFQTISKYRRGKMETRKMRNLRLVSVILVFLIFLLLLLSFKGGSLSI